MSPALTQSLKTFDLLPLPTEGQHPKSLGNLTFGNHFGAMKAPCKGVKKAVD